MLDKKGEFVEMLIEHNKEEAIQEKSCLDAMLQRLQSRVHKVEDYFENLYEKNIDGEVADEWFMNQSQRYGDERTELKARITAVQDRLTAIENIRQNKDNFIFAVRRFMEMRELSAPILRELIDKIEVYETEGVGNNRTQRIKIRYNFLGEIEIDDYQS